MKAKALIPFYDFNGSEVSDKRVIGKIPNKKTIKIVVENDLNHYYKNIKELAHFLVECIYIEDEKHFNLPDYWMNPIHFEYEKQGDCEDFSLFTWKQLVHMGLDARFVVGNTGRKNGHAWCQAVINNKKYIIEPLMAKVPFLPSFAFQNYKPNLSVGIKDSKPVYYTHYNLNKKGFIVQTIYLILKSILIYPIIITTFLILIGPLSLVAHIKIKKLQYQRRWT